MPDHIHVLINPLYREASDILRKIKGESARIILDRVREENDFRKLKRLQVFKRGQKHSVWQPRSVDVDIISVAMVKQKLKYIHENPVKAKLCTNAVDWKCSSAAEYAGCGVSPLRIDRAWYWSEFELRAAGRI